MRLIAMVLRIIFRPKLSSASVLQERPNWSFDHVPAYVKPGQNPNPRLEAARQRVQTARLIRPRRDRNASDACIVRYLAAKREELFHRPPRLVA